ncbi:hypothetical protein J5Y09_02075 [Roseomonas sp. PWR1]|uniref:Uncharacterized protein n=1 Tax=Roseomonas nitratireducens TaxID=2820810 RepID=A0ABS4AQ41_9PROT|nr:hypothetical protein [Neoroseomonas nitratireducens]MBP0462687.1 hypothetical protein [Neoroseomonas nitratireducens]
MRFARLPRGAAALVALALLPAAPAAAHWEYTRWGMSEAQVATAGRGAVRPLPAGERRPVPAARMEYRATAEFRAATLALTVAFAFDGRTGGLVCVSATGGAGQGAALRARLERAFGAPQERATDPSTGTTVLGWTRPDEIDLQIAANGAVTMLHCARGV